MVSATSDLSFYGEEKTERKSRTQGKIKVGTMVEIQSCKREGMFKSH